ncbi:MAG: 16S rRNA (cytosine(1402)-N(4))-methyltransferase RsmH [bacterium]
MKALHTPVMLSEVLKYLALAPGKRYLDATLGFGGHTIALLEKGAEVVGVDRDQDILPLATKRIAEAGLSEHFTPLHSSFSEVFSNPELTGEFDGILFDLGVSSYQLDTPERGFSFRFEAPLDMRMDKNLAVTAADLINGLGRKELHELFTELGEEHNSRRLVEAIILARKEAPLKTTTDLVKIVENTVHGRGKIHPATKIFQALRMAVNSEREELKAALPSALSRLAAGGVIVVISFHSLEDKIVKSFLTEFEGRGELEIIGDNPTIPSLEEVKINHRSRSAKMRVGRKLK